MITFSHFNSIKVRLKHQSKQMRQSGSTFQFHKGTIKTIRILLLKFLLIYFNSIKVRLKQQMVLLILFFHLFQFHKGTIKTSAPIDFIIIATQFQFHKGTIKTRKAFTTQLSISNFNSIKVRLKHSGFKTRRNIVKFQFHKGTIKTLL